MRNVETKDITINAYAAVHGVTPRSARNWCAAYLADPSRNPLPAPATSCRRKGKRDYIVTVDAAEHDRLKAAQEAGRA